ncbi:MAG: type II secretion system GspH family protein [Armatimonadetes bacterium]|nr:type II secretion system GspH family protein [Armatimonadota bacterium]
MKPSRRSGFTLIEIMVVLVLATILSSITFGAFRSISQGNKRTTCQSNLSQIYKSARLYAQDYNGKFPYLNTGAAMAGATDLSATPIGGVGLWSLYTFPKGGANNCSTDYSTGLDLPFVNDPNNQLPPENELNQKLAGYVRSAKIFHCPADRFDKTIQVRTSSTTCATSTVPTASLSIQQDGATYLNPSYLSYQTIDDLGPTPRDTYSSFRASGLKRQVTYFSTTSSGVTETPERPSDDKTVITWCRFHRSLDNTGATVTGSRNFDNVLFYDGTVQSLPMRAVRGTSEPCDTLGGTCVGGWQREPKPVR